MHADSLLDQPHSFHHISANKRLPPTAFCLHLSLSPTIVSAAAQASNVFLSHISLRWLQCCHPNHSLSLICCLYIRTPLRHTVITSFRPCIDPSVRPSILPSAQDDEENLLAQPTRSSVSMVSLRTKLQPAAIPVKAPSASAAVTSSPARASSSASAILTAAAAGGSSTPFYKRDDQKERAPPSPLNPPLSPQAMVPRSPSLSRHQASSHLSLLALQRLGEVRHGRKWMGGGRVGGRVTLLCRI